jgi:hypothetical protein
MIKTFKRMAVAAVFLSGLSPVLLARDAFAAFEKIDPMGCESKGVLDLQDLCPSSYQCESLTVRAMYAFMPELQVSDFSTSHTFYCPVPDDSGDGVDLINSYQITGFSPTGSGSAARGCVQFTNGFSESCVSGMFPFPEGDFQDWSMPIPSNWTQFWNNAYVEVRLNSYGGGSGAAIRNIYASTP